ncbi:PepSY domain-containing protein [Stutzerimonas stutzeri]|uniref:PepSY domain-containing protein n=1 Tax=Stutzerimonas sp. S1 TaxID=3030652 RepID=UPI0022249358|nr:PepSY domain-containing protein [Stutzerimonas sp. S1]MCW3150453.1 PepSY domain-containing protein [Stutzerimonas sp. S1]
MKRYLFLAHRWLGIVLGVFVLLWIISGAVMLYVGYPKLTSGEHLARLAPLAGDCCVAPGVALAAAGARPVSRLRLTSAGGSPRYLVDYGEGPLVAVDARSGRRIERIGPGEALASARQFAGGAAVRLVDLIEEDAWTRNHALARERPLYRVQSADAEGRLLYVSSHTGLVVRDASTRERAWNYLGAWLHWLYPLRELLPKAAWAVALVHGALLAGLMVLLGLLIGLLRWRFAGRYRNGSRSPYPSGAGRLHHVGGLLGGGVLLVWLVSGLLSMEPWGLFVSRSTIDVEALHGTLRPQVLGDNLPGALRQLRRAGIEPVELQWRMLGGEAYLTGIDARGETRILSAAGGPPLARLDQAVLERSIRRAWPAQRPQFDWLAREDFHYYARSEPSLYSDLPRRLPVLRVRFDDPAATWLHIDPYSGAVLEQLDERRRAVRWLFKLLHSWDWPPLLRHAGLRDGLLLALSAGVLLIAATGVILGWRRLRRRSRQRAVAAKTSGTGARLPAR